MADGVEILFAESAEGDGAEDEIVSAYRLGAFGQTGAYVRVKKSEIESDKNLFELPKKTLSLGFDAQKTAATKSETLKPADPHVLRKIQHKLMFKDIKRRIEEENITLDRLPWDLDIKSINDPVAQQILMLVTDQLKSQGLWRDEDKDLTMSEAFPLSQTKIDPKLPEDDVKAIEYGTYLDEDERTHDDFTKANFDRPSNIGALPTLATPMIHNLMRSSPRDLYHQVARRLLDSDVFDGSSSLFRPCFFISKGVEDEAHFEALMASQAGGAFPHYTFQEFRKDRIHARKALRPLIDNYFSTNPTVKRCLKQNADPLKQDPKNFWRRFDQVWCSLTNKQQEALEVLYMDPEPLTRPQAAAEFGITIDSLDSRVRTAIDKFKWEFPELEGVTPKGLSRDQLRGEFTHNGLWWYRDAAFIHPLYHVDVATGARHETQWFKVPRSKNLDWKSVARIKAEVIENCPVPFIHETEYFDGMKPTIMSFGRRPGNCQETLDPTFDLNEVFRDG